MSDRVEVAYDFTWEDVRRIEEARWRGYRGGLLPHDFPDDARLKRHWRRPEGGYAVVFEVSREYARSLGLDDPPSGA
jgi:hypothetical protein